MPLSIQTPTSFWRLEEASGTRVDSAAGGNDLNLNNGAPGNTTGKIGLALSCVAASSQYVGIADNASMSMGAGVSFSFSAWFNSNLASDCAILGKTNEYILYFLTASKSMNLLFENGPQYTVGTLANTVTAANTWYHVACWFDAVTGNRGITVNNGTPVVNTTLGSLAKDGTSPFRIGESYGILMNGAIDAVGYWKNYALTATDITNLYNGGGVALGTEYYSGAWQSSILGGPFQSNMEGNMIAGMNGGMSG